jgi:hypothetical protein
MKVLKSCEKFWKVEDSKDLRWRSDIEENGEILNRGRL